MLIIMFISSSFKLLLLLLEPSFMELKSHSKESESSKLFAEQKEEEVKILEHMLRNLNLP
jgi:hypothetical protein